MPGRGTNVSRLSSASVYVLGARGSFSDFAGLSFAATVGFSGFAALSGRATFSGLGVSAFGAFATFGAFSGFVAFLDEASPKMLNSKVLGILFGALSASAL